MKKILSLMMAAIILPLFVSCSEPRTQPLSTVTVTQTSYASTDTHNTQPNVTTSTVTMPATTAPITITQTTPTVTSPTYTPTTPTLSKTILIAASDSSDQWKSQATVICDGKADQSEINTYLATGNTVILAPGNFWCNGWIYPQTGSHLTGSGDNSVINLSNTTVFILNSNNVELDHFKLTGTAYYAGAIILTAIHTVTSGFYLHDILITAKNCTDFSIYAGTNSKLSNIAFVRCNADNPDGFGFIIDGEGTTPIVEDVTFFKCSVENAGVAPTRLLASEGTSWITGFDFAEYAGLTVNRVQAINCSVNGAWESDFHFEGAPTKQDVVIIDCFATNAGQKTGGATFGAGYFIDGTQDIIFNGNTGFNNSAADLTIWIGGNSLSKYAPVQNMILPTSSTKTISRVDQNNCSGIIINIDSTHKELIFYSNDENPVNQQIELGDYYASSADYIFNNGKTYSFNGTEIVTQFNDYAIIRLVKTTPPTTTTTTTTNPTTTMTTSPTTTLTATTTTVTTKTFPIFATAPTTTLTTPGTTQTETRKASSWLPRVLIIIGALIMAAVIVLVMGKRKK